MDNTSKIIKNRIAGRMAVEKKKAVMAGVLAVVMAVMWIKVLVGKDTSKAEAAAAKEQKTGQTGPVLKIEKVDLPFVEGRNDVLTRDFFTAGDWNGFFGRQERKTSDDGFNLVSGYGSEGYVKSVENKLKLDAIEFGPEPKAFINDRLCAVGDMIFVFDSGNKYECEIMKIERNSVYIGFGQAKIILKLDDLGARSD